MTNKTRTPAKGRKRQRKSPCTECLDHLERGNLKKRKKEQLRMESFFPSSTPTGSECAVSTNIRLTAVATEPVESLDDSATGVPNSSLCPGEVRGKARKAGKQTSPGQNHKTNGVQIRQSASDCTLQQLGEICFISAESLLVILGRLNKIEGQLEAIIQNPSQLTLNAARFQPLVINAEDAIKSSSSIQESTDYSSAQHGKQRKVQQLFQNNQILIH